LFLPYRGAIGHGRDNLTRYGSDVMSKGAWWHRGKRVLASTVAGIAVAIVLIAAWLLPAPARAPDRTIAGEPETHSIYTSSCPRVKSLRPFYLIARLEGGSAAREDPTAAAGGAA
jgi:hypothetical protein